MGKAIGWIAAAALALGLAGGAGAAPLAFDESLPLCIDEISHAAAAPPVAEPDQASAEAGSVLSVAPEPSTLVFLLVGLAGLSVLSRRQLC